MNSDEPREIVAQELSAEAFSAFGEVVEASERPGRAYFETSIENARSAARPRMWMLTKLPSDPLPLTFNTLERHQFSSQTFVPIDLSRWLVVVAPHHPGGGPDVDRVEAFLARPTQAVSYRANVWHGSLTVFDKLSHLNVFMWLDGSAADEEFVSVPPFIVRERQR
jgi:ureidoglycolate lyase